MGLISRRSAPRERIELVIDNPAGSGLAYLVGSETVAIDLGTLTEGSTPFPDPAPKLG